MIRKRKIFLNASSAALQSLVSGVTLFFLYGFLLQSIGAEDLGVWALVMATTSTASIANLGIATSTIKYIAQYVARDKKDHVSSIIQTSSLSIAIILGCLLPLIFVPLSRLLEGLIEPIEKIPDALMILPYALVSFWLNSVSGVYQSCIDGFQRVDLRGAILIVATVGYLGLALYLVPLYGLLGLAYAQVIQAGFILITTWVSLKILLPNLPVLPYKWRWATFKEILGYSLNFQVISVSQLLLEPVTKALISKFGGIGTLAYFEMANKMVFQLRALIASAHRALVPTLTDIHEKTPAYLQSIYQQSFKALVFLLLAILPFCIAITPLISKLWIGAYNMDFIVFASLIFAGWFLNLIANPAYFENMGTGHLFWNVTGHLSTGVLNILLGLLLGYYYGSTGIVVGFVCAILTGSLMIVSAYHKKYQIRLSQLIDRSSVWLSLAGTVSLVLSIAAYLQFGQSMPTLLLSVIVMGIFLGLTGLPLWKHPLRYQITTWFRSLSATT